MSSNPSDFAEDIYAEMAALAARFELRARMVAGLSPHTRKAAHDAKLKIVLQKIKSQLPTAATEADWKRLDLGRQVRNKLLHCELHQVARLVNAPAGTVKMLKFDGPATLESLVKGISSAGGVSGLSTKEAGIFGWMLEFETSGGHRLVTGLFTDCLETLSRLANMMSTQEGDKP